MTRRNASAGQARYGPPSGTAFGGPIGATDGRCTYYLYPQDLHAPGLHEYTLMPMHLSSLFSASEMNRVRLAVPSQAIHLFDATSGRRVDA